MLLSLLQSAFNTISFFSARGVYDRIDDFLFRQETRRTLPSGAAIVNGTRHLSNGADLPDSQPRREGVQSTITFLRETSITSREDTIQRSRIRAVGHFRLGTEIAFLVILPTSGHFRPINVKAKHIRTAIYDIYRTHLDRITAVTNALPTETTLYSSLGPILRAL